MSPEVGMRLVGLALLAAGGFIMAITLDDPTELVLLMFGLPLVTLGAMIHGGMNAYESMKK